MLVNERKFLDGKGDRYVAIVPNAISAIADRVAIVLEVKGNEANFLDFQCSRQSNGTGHVTVSWLSI